MSPPDATGSPEGEPVDQLSSPHQAITETRQTDDSADLSCERASEEWRIAAARSRDRERRAHYEGLTEAGWRAEYRKAGCA
jgi:hypothetical protein